MLALKERGGVRKLEEVIAQARKLHAMDRISQADMARLVDVLYEAIAVIQTMVEYDAAGEEI